MRGLIELDVVPLEFLKAYLKRVETARIQARHRGFECGEQELAFDLLNITWQDTMENNIVNQLIEVKTVGLGDPDYVNENLRGMRAYWQGKGGQILSDMLRYQRTIMPREEMAVAIDLHRDEILLDFWSTVQKSGPS